MEGIRELCEQLYGTARKQVQLWQGLQTDTDTDTALRTMETLVKKRQEIMDAMDREAAQGEKLDETERDAVRKRLLDVQMMDETVRHHMATAAAAVQERLRSAQGGKQTHAFYHRNTQSEGFFIDRRS